MKIKYFVLNKRLRAEKQIRELQNLSLSDVKKRLFWFAKRLPDIVHLKELVFFTFFFSFVIFILFVQRYKDLDNYFIEKKPAFGGLYVEGVVGSIESFNPLYEGLNPAEDDVNKLVFSGLLKYKDDKPFPNIAKSWEVLQDGKVYVFHLRDDAKWHDGQKLDAEDVVYTIQSIQDPDVRSTYSGIFRDVVSEAPDPYTLKLTLPASNPSFLSNLDFGILPRHLYEKTPGRNMMVAKQNQSPVGSGPYRFDKIEKKQSYSQVFLNANTDADAKPFIAKVRVRTYGDEDSMIEGYAKKEIMAISNISLSKLDAVKKLQNITFLERYFPRYTALFFNQKSETMKNKNLRTALALSVDEKSISGIFDKEKVLNVESPVVPGHLGYNKDIKDMEYDPSKAEEILKKDGWVKDGSVLKKAGKELRVSFYTSNTEEFKSVSESVKEQWEKIGVVVDLTYLDSKPLQEDHIKPRSYDVLLYGITVGSDMDLYNVWHSSQKNDPGLNLSYFSNSRSDKYIELAQKSIDKQKSEEMIFKAQELIMEDMPAVFLYNPAYIYGINRSVKGTDISKIIKQSDRFFDIENWYIREETR
ncbi:hypothetical protein COY62_03605 [bacterium (Candidatus Howlettbacteria) CG_4_10_14_0_8_um_filter_40_9]|nr:MAG: hypothetical protein COY62_03605 [bacterium (Candidatus Howlettbacteria) CG_4_10_14_0_8_um_filter_40_9]